MEPWNQKQIQQPSMNTAVCDIEIDVASLEHALKNIVTILSKQAPLHKESALLSRFLYKFDRKFRNDIGYKKFKKVNSALRKYLTLDLLKDVTNFLTLLPDDYDITSYLPTRQTLEYVLVRIMTFAKIMLRVTICSKQSAIFYLNRIKRGESHWMSFMPYALLSRIWSMSLVLLQHSCTWYNRLHSFITYFVPKGLKFLPENYELPKDLGVWIDINNLNEEGRFNWCLKSKFETDNLLLENEEGDLCENILMFVNQVNSTDESDKDLQSITQDQIKLEDFKNPVIQDDLGEALSRDSFKQLNNKLVTNVEKNEIKHSIQNVKNLEMLQKFVEQEDIYRNESSELSLTSHISFMQWQSLKTALLKFENTIIRDKKLQIKVQKMWKEKCVDYL